MQIDRLGTERDKWFCNEFKTQTDLESWNAYPKNESHVMLATDFKRQLNTKKIVSKGITRKSYGGTLT